MSKRRPVERQPTGSSPATARRSALLLVLAVMLAGCGKKGTLRLPEDAEEDDE